MATDVFYNGVQIHNVLTRRWDEEVVYDDSGADAIFTRFYLEFEGLIHLQTAIVADLDECPVFTKPEVNQQATNASELYQQIRACLWEPRNSLQVVFNGETVLEATHADDGHDSYADVDNGPRPKMLSIIHVCSNLVFRVRYGIECALVECCSDVGNQGFPADPQFVLNNRWSVGETMDSNFYTTRTIRGRIRCSQAMANNLHSLRPSTFPTLEQGFKRESIDFTVAANGLEADYTVIDRQVHTAAPWPATKISGHFAESQQMATMRFSELHVRLEGPPNADKRMLMTRAAQIAFCRLGSETQISNSASLVEEIVLYEEIGELNAIELRIRLNRTPGGDANSGAFIGNLPVSTWGQPLSLPGTPTNYDPSQSPVGSPYGYTSGEENPRDPSDPTNPAVVLYALRCYLQTPCDDKHFEEQETSLSQAATEGAPSEQYGIPAETQVTTTTVGELPTFTGNSLINEAATVNIYRFAKMTSEYKVRRVRVGLPIAGDVTDTTSDATRVITLGRPQAVREIIYDAERVGAPPALPSPDDTYVDGAIKGTLLDHKVELFPSMLSVDGTQRIYRARSFSLYQLNRAPTATETLLVGKLPFSDVTQADERADPTVIYDQSLGPADVASGDTFNLLSE